MKKSIYVLLLLFISSIGFTQNPNPKSPNRILGLKIAYITRQLNLTTDESTKFWPVYFNYSDETNAIKKENAINNNVLAGDEKLLAVKKKYWGQFKSVLVTDERVNKVFLSERNFSNMIRKEIESRQKMKQQRFLPK